MINEDLVFSLDWWLCFFCLSFYNGRRSSPEVPLYSVYIRTAPLLVYVMTALRSFIMAVSVSIYATVLPMPV